MAGGVGEPVRADQASRRPRALGKRDAYLNLLQRRLQALTYDRVLGEGRALIGDSHAVLDQLHHLRQQFGPIQPEMQIMFGNMDYTHARRSVELFGREVLPAVEGL